MSPRCPQRARPHLPLPYTSPVEAAAASSVDVKYHLYADDREFQVHTPNWLLDVSMGVSHKYLGGNFGKNMVLESPRPQSVPS